MKKILNFLLDNKILIAILLIIAIGFPTAIFKKAQGELTTIVVAVGIDKEEGKYRISIQSANSLIKNTQTSASINAQGDSTPKLEVVDELGESLTDAINKLEIKTGRTLGFEHCHLIVLSDSVTSENCKNVLDFFYRKANITLGAYLISTDKSAKTVLEKTCESENTSTSNLQKNLGFNKNNFASANLTTIGDFFNDFYSESKTSSMAFLKSETVMESGSSLVENNGDSAIFYNGKKFSVIDRNLTSGLNFVNLETVNGKMVLTNVNDGDVFNDATVSVKIDEGKIKKSISAENDLAIINLQITLKIEVLEINTANENMDVSAGVENYLTDVLKDKIKEKIEGQVQAFHSYCKLNKIDVGNFFNFLYAYKNSEYKNMLNRFGVDEILENSVVNTKIDVYSFR